jgi:hypothetical protein
MTGTLRTRANGVLACVLTAVLLSGGLGPGASPAHGSTPATLRPMSGTGERTSASAVGNFSAAINRLVELLGLAGSGLLSLVWARVALSWFSNDLTKKVQAKDRARDALVGTLLFTAAITGLFWGLSQWVLTGG